MSDIDLKKAADATLKYIDMVGKDNGSLLPENEYIPNELTVDHQIDLCQQIVKGTLWGEKAHRCFGWAQAALMMNGIGSLTVYRMINYCCRTD